MYSNSPSAMPVIVDHVPTYSDNELEGPGSSPSLPHETNVRQKTVIMVNAIKLKYFFIFLDLSICDPAMLVN